MDTEGAASEEEEVVLAGVAAAEVSAGVSMMESIVHRIHASSFMAVRPAAEKITRLLSVDRDRAQVHNHIISATSGVVKKACEPCHVF